MNGKKTQNVENKRVTRKGETKRRSCFLLVGSPCFWIAQKKKRGGGQAGQKRDFVGEIQGEPHAKKKKKRKIEEY